MFGIRRLKRRYRRFRYNNQARFPRLFVVYDMIKLPLQILLVALPLWVVVGLYNEHFSFEAQTQQSRLLSANDSSVESGVARNTNPEDSPLAGMAVPIVRNQPALQIGSEAELSADQQAILNVQDTGEEFDLSPPKRIDAIASNPQVLAENKLLKDAMAVLGENTGDEAKAIAEVTTGGATLPAGSNGTLAGTTDPVGNSAASGPELIRNDHNVLVKTVPVSVIRELPDNAKPPVTEPLFQSDKQTKLTAVMAQLSGPVDIHRDDNMVESVVIEPVADRPVSVRGRDWLAAQDDRSYVIQLESSANSGIMEEKALELSVADDLAIYPFVVSRQGEVIYGLSYGLYETLGQARKASAELPDELVRFGTWIRRVGTLKQQMKVVEQSAE